VYVLLRALLPCRPHLVIVARNRQVCIYWWWKHCLLLSILPGERANTYTHRKILSVECLSRANSWSLSSCAFPAGSCPAEIYECSSVRMYERTNLRIATETRPARNSHHALRNSVNIKNVFYVPISLAITKCFQYTPWLRPRGLWIVLCSRGRRLSWCCRWFYGRPDHD
jgi:hypothetical protein